MLLTQIFVFSFLLSWYSNPNFILFRKRTITFIFLFGFVGKLPSAHLKLRLRDCLVENWLAEVSSGSSSFGWFLNARDKRIRSRFLLLTFSCSVRLSVFVTNRWYCLRSESFLSVFFWVFFCGNVYINPYCFCVIFSLEPYYLPMSKTDVEK